MKVDESAIRTSQYEERIISYLDIMGFTDRILNSVTDIDDQHLVFDIINRFNQISGLDARDSFEIESHSFVSTAFSDIFICSERADAKHSILNILRAAIANQWALAQEGFMVRGAITVGQLHHNRHVIFGPALIKAYQLESKTAKYPRVIVSCEAVRHWEEYMSTGAPVVSTSGDVSRQAANNIKLGRDRDDLFTTDFLANDYTRDKVQHLRRLSKYRTAIEENLLRSETPSHIRAKYEWLCAYWNNAVGKLGESAIDLRISDFVTA